MGNRSPLLNVIFQSLNNVTRNLLRDFGEIENLQVSPNSLEEFVSKTEKKISTSLLFISERSNCDFSNDMTSRFFMIDWDIFLMAEDTCPFFPISKIGPFIYLSI